eukprot:11187202-Lingulodinium_polyedra.AAC.1
MHQSFKSGVKLRLVRLTRRVRPAEMLLALPGAPAFRGTASASVSIGRRSGDVGAKVGLPEGRPTTTGAEVTADTLTAEVSRSSASA